MPELKLKSLQEIQSLAHVGSWEFFLQDQRVIWSDEMYKIYQKDPATFEPSLEKTTQMIIPEDRVKFKQAIEKVMHTTEEQYVTYTIRRDDGSYAIIEAHGKSIHDEDGKPYKVIGTTIDITKHIELKKENDELVYIIKHAVSEIYILDLYTHRYLFANDGALKNLGYTMQELGELTVYDINPKLTHQHVNELVRLCEEKGSITNISEHLRKDGSRYPVQAVIQEIIYKSKQAYIIFDTDISTLKKVEEELYKQKEMLYHMAHHDALTNLPNRILFHDRLNQAIKKAKRDSSSLALLFIDLDRFKQINDSLGHDIGDIVLQEVSKRFISVIREEDTLARLGGDEFTILAEGLHHFEDASVLANKLIECMMSPFSIKSHLLYITCSIGISLYPQDGDNVDDLVKYADVAMYKAKDNGRNNYNFYSSKLTDEMHEQVHMITSLHKALENNEFEIYFQPQIDISDNSIIGMEVLIRWRHPKMGMIPPLKFIPLAEETGFVVDIDRWVMQEALEQFSTWYAMGLNPGVLALNLSMKQLQKSDFLEFLQESMKKTGSKSEWIELELTESSIMKNPKEAIEILHRINALGISIAIDDFGTGYSSLAYLKKLPINKLKIDKSFLDEIPKNEEDMAIAKTIIVLAKSLKMNIIAEGVERQEQENFLREHGCVNMQGYYYSKPIDRMSMQNMLMQQRDK